MPQALAAPAAGPSSLPDPQLAAAHQPLTGLQLASPWGPASPQLTSILWADTFGLLGKNLPITREVAMQVPSLARARHLVCGFGAKAQPVVFRGDVKRATQPRWISRTGSQLTPYHRMLWTLDDHFFSGWSLWDVERVTEGGPITGAATRVPMHRWSFERETGDVLVDGEPFPAKRALLIPGPHEGVLTFGREAIPPLTWSCTTRATR
jgi:hypothetical protein